MPKELRNCLSRGADTTLMVWADLDHDMADGNQLKNEFWTAAQNAGIERVAFEKVVFAFAKDRLENWIEFLRIGTTDETQEGPRVKNNRDVADAARVLAERCRSNQPDPPLPASLAWSCQNWQALVERMK